MSDLSHIPDEAVEAAAMAFAAAQYGDAAWDEILLGATREALRTKARAVLAAALPYLNTARPRLASGDVPITERTPHGVWIADGPDPDREYTAPNCAGLSGCDDCRAYDDLRQHLVKQIIALDEQHQRETAALHAFRDREITELLRAAVFEISRLRSDWVNAYVERAQKAWRGGSWRSSNADRAEREAITKWNANHAGLIALWKSYQDRAASLRGEPGE